MQQGYNRFLEHSADLDGARSAPGMGKSGMKGDSLPIEDALQTAIAVTTELNEFLEEYLGPYNEPQQENKVKTARNAKPRPTKATMTSHAQFKRDEELFPRLRIHRKTRAVVWFGCREGGLVVHAGAQDSPFVFSQVVDVGGRLKYGDFDDYVGTIVLSNT